MAGSLWTFSPISSPVPELNSSAVPDDPSSAAVEYGRVKAAKMRPPEPGKLADGNQVDDENESLAGLDRTTCTTIAVG